MAHVTIDPGLDLVEYFKALAGKYNELEKCGFCWTYGAPLSESGMNKQELDEETVCCMNMFLTELKMREETRFSSSTGLQNFDGWTFEFTLFVGKQVEDIGTNVYNEIPGYAITDSLWDQIYKPLQNCLGFNRELFICELGYDFDVTKWIMDKFQYKDDKNLCGWKIQGAFRIKKFG